MEKLNMKNIELNDKNPNVEYFYRIGEDEEPWGLSQPWCLWEETKTFDTFQKASNANAIDRKNMTGQREWVTDIGIRYKDETEAKQKLRDYRYKVFTAQQNIEKNIPDWIAKLTKQLEELKAKLPEEEQKLEGMEADFEKKFGYRLSRW